MQCYMPCGWRNNNSPATAKIGTVNQPFVIFLEAASQTATALLK
jgi:hypothetical protein